MSTELFRKYIDIVSDNQQLNEGLISDAFNVAKEMVKKLPSEAIKKVQELVSNALGKPVDQLSMDDVTIGNIKKVVAANKGVQEADQNFRWTDMSGSRDYGMADIPGSEKKNKIQAAGIGGVLSYLVGGPAAALMGVTGALPLAMVVGGLAIIVAFLASRTASADQAKTGHYYDKNPFPALNNPKVKPEVKFDPKMRDPRLGPVDKDKN